MSEQAAGGTTVQRMRGLDVRYISLCGAGKNGRSIIAKALGAGELPDGAEVIEKEIAIRKADAAKRMVYGVVYAPESVDADGHVASAAEIEKAMHGFMQDARVGQVDTNHDEQVGVGYVAESWLVKADESGAVVDALFPDEPAGTWAVGIKVADDASWAKVEKGELGGLSLAGVATLEAEEVAEVDESVAKGFVDKVKQLLGLDDGETAVRKKLMAAPDSYIPTPERGLPVDHYIPTPERLADPHTAALTRLLATMIAGSDAMTQMQKGKLMAAVDSYIPTPDRGAGPTDAAMMAAMLAGMLGAVAAPTPATETDPSTTPLGVHKAALVKGFTERMLRAQLWRVSEALTDGIRDVLDDDDVTDKAAGVRTVVAEFEAWLTAQMGGGTVDVAMAKSADDDAGDDAGAVDNATGGDGALGVIPPELVERIEQLEKATPGRQSVLGGADVRVQKEQKKGLRIV